MRSMPPADRDKVLRYCPEAKRMFTGVSYGKEVKLEAPCDEVN